MLLQVAAFGLVFLVLFALGAGALSVIRALGAHRRTFSPGAFELAWIGLAVAIAILQLWSLFDGLGGGCALALVAAAAPGAVPARRWLRRAARPRALLSIAVAGALALVVAREASEPSSWADTLATHIQQVMWARDYGAVLGLGNLSVKFALDQSAHLFAAVLEHGPFRDASLRVAVPFFVWLTLAQWAQALIRRSRSDGDARAKIYCLLTVPWLCAKVRSRELPSLSGDLPMGCAAMALGHALLRLPFVPRARLRLMLSRHADEAWLIGTLAALCATLKLSGATLTLVGLAVLAASSIVAGRRWALTAWTLPVSLGVGLVARRVALSGWLAFPAPIGDLHLPWSMTEAAVRGEYRCIRSWARLELRTPEDVLDHGFKHWFLPWLEGPHGFLQTTELRVLLLALVVLAVRALVARRRFSPVELIALTAPALSLVYWFVTAPDVRFGGVFFWMLLGVCTAPLLAIWDRRGLTLPILLLAVLAHELVVPRAPTWGGGTPRSPRWTHVEPLSAHYLTDPRALPNPDGPPLIVNVPRWGRQFCGDAPLPCTPFPATQRLRVPGRLSSGFLP